MDSLTVDDHVDIKIPPSPIPVTVTAPQDAKMPNGTTNKRLPQSYPAPVAV